MCKTLLKASSSSSSSSSTPASRHVVGWQVADPMRKDLVVDASRMDGAPVTRVPSADVSLVHHSPPGVTDAIDALLADGKRATTVAAVDDRELLALSPAGRRPLGVRAPAPDVARHRLCNIRPFSERMFV